LVKSNIISKKSILDFDASRTIRNGFIGLCFGPLVHEYYQFSDHILPVEGGMMNRIQKIIMDQTIYLLVKCSIYIVAVGLLQGDSWDTSIANVKNKIGPICFTAWKFWPLVHLITYNVIPARHRILWVNCVDLVWNAILASKASSPTSTSDDDLDQLASTLKVTSIDDNISHEIATLPANSSDNSHHQHSAEMPLQSSTGEPLKVSEGAAVSTVNH
jgi:Mpv17 / PMP22 family